jgi:peptide/nickel transport system permease protein
VNLRNYIIRRVLLIIPTIIGVTLVIFALTRAGGVNSVISGYINPHLPYGPQKAAIIRTLGLNRPLIIQYFYFLSGIIHGNWGYTNTPIYVGSVTNAIIFFFPNTIELAIVAFSLTMLIALPLGTAAARRKDSWVDQISRVLAFIGYSLPSFWVAALVMMYLGTSKGLNLLPISGTISVSLLHSVRWISSNGVSSPTHFLLVDALIHANIVIFINALEHIILPAITLTFISLAGIMRYMRNSMVEVLNTDYVKFARAKGLRESVVYARYARKNALLPVVTIMGLNFAGLLGGVVVIEEIFNYPGIGYWTYEALVSSDSGGIMGATLLFAITLVTANLIIDIIYAFIDPRIRLGD